MSAHFLAPWRLLLLLGVAALVAAYVVLARRRSRYAVRFTELDLLASVAPRRPGWRRHVPAGLLALALVVLTAGFARPQSEVDVPAERATVVVALDVSLSMEAVDVDPTRLSAAQQSATGFVDSLPARFNVGLVSFSKVASVVVPPTQDHRAVTRAVQDLQLSDGTAIGEAVLASLGSLALVPGERGGPPPPARIVLLSDGTNTQGRSVADAEAAATRAGVPVSTIAFGTQAGTVEIQTENGRQRIPVPVDRAALRDLAESTGGTAFTAESGSALSDVYRDIGSQVGTTTQLREVTSRYTGLGLLLAAVAAGLGLAWGTRLP